MKHLHDRANNYADQLYVQHEGYARAKMRREDDNMAQYFFIGLLVLGIAMPQALNLNLTAKIIGGIIAVFGLWAEISFIKQKRNR